jgi:integrative and conjugative element protein (TIGR02256 family)
VRPRLWRAWLSEEAASTIRAAAQAAHPDETGGVLVGVLNKGRPWITHAVEVPSGASTGTWFEIDGSKRQRVVREARKIDSAIGYLGEWHSHPADVGPSATDLTTMRRLAADPDSGCPRPVLLIARHQGSNYSLDARQVSQRGSRRLRLVAAGPLPIDPHAHGRERRRTRRPTVRFTR